MREYIVRRLLASLPVLIGVSLIIFVLMRLVPGDVAAAMLSIGAEGGASGTQETVTRLREELGLLRPLHEQYLLWLGNALRGDFGYSYWFHRPVAEELAQALPVTVELAVLGFMISLFIAVPIGVVSAIRQDTWQDYVGRLFAIGGLSIPEFWVGTMMVLLPLWWFGWIPPVRFTPLFENPWENLQQVGLPALALGLHLASNVMRMLRSQMLEVLRQDYIRTAWAKGLRERSVIVRHALKNALIPVVTLLGLRIGRLLGGAVVLEQVFTLPGMGRLVVQAVVLKDYLVIQAVVLVFALIFVLINLLVDILYAWLDPRIRYA